MYILGISAYYHDSAACLVKDGDIIFAAQEERYTRKKQDESFPIHAIRDALKYADITVSDIDYIAFYDKPLLKFERILETYLHSAPRGIQSFLKAVPTWIKKKMWIKDHIRKELNYSGKILFPEHHLSHAASAFFPSPFQTAAFLTIDGVGEWSTTSYGVGNGNELSILGDIRFPHSLGLLYSAFTYYCGFKVNSGEYKLMGLAPYGEPRYKDIIRGHLVDIKDDGSFKLNLDYFDFVGGLRMTNSKFHQLFGMEPRQQESSIDQKTMDIAASIQEVTEEVVEKMARHVRKVTGKKYLCLAGGVALNCVANGKILKNNIFDDVWVQPASGDAGGALGAALTVWYQYLDNKRLVSDMTDSMQGALCGPAYSDDQIEQYLKKNNIPFSKLPDMINVYQRTAELINDQQVVGWFQGRMEYGPRALGNRSILGDARSPHMQQTINLKIKYREGFRPFAPSVLEEEISDYFNIDRPSPYMVLVADVAKKYRKTLSKKDRQTIGLDRLHLDLSTVPAITHVDGSARIQSVSKETNPHYHNLISTFYKKYGCPLIINTSFNVRGEPIVRTPQDAYRCFMRTQMDYLVMGSYVLDKKDQPPPDPEDDWKEHFPLD